MKIYQIDAFTDQLFAGNPAAVCPLEAWLPDDIMQKIAMENNLAETAFIVPKGDIFHIRWFTPTVEVDLCGHATLAAAHVFYTFLNYAAPKISFDSKSGLLSVAKNGDVYTLDFPVDILKEVRTPKEITKGLGIKPIATYRGVSDFLAVVENEDIIKNLKPDFRQLVQLFSRGTIVTARGSEVDFVSRCFFPQSGIDEDPVTGSAHTTLVPYWATVLKKNELSAYQLSKRKGKLHCKLKDSRVEISGKAVTYMVGEVFL